MNWYRPLRRASKPPAYIQERLSDLQYASELSKTSPSGARHVVDKILAQLDEHMDHEYVDDLKTASEVMLDSPKKARDIIGIISQYMRADKRRFDREKAHPWQNWQR